MRCRPASAATATIARLSVMQVPLGSVERPIDFVKAAEPLAFAPRPASCRDPHRGQRRDGLGYPGNAPGRRAFTVQPDLPATEPDGQQGIARLIGGATDEAWPVVGDVTGLR